MCAQSVSFKFDRNKTFYPIHPITIYHTRTRQPIVLRNMASDSGSTTNFLNFKHAEPLGLFDLSTGSRMETRDAGGAVEVGYRHKLTMRIGSLKPITTTFVFDDDSDDGTLGREALNNFRIVYNHTSVTYHELLLKQAAYVNAYYSQPAWRKRI